MTIYDAYGRAVDTSLLHTEQAAPTMTGIRNIYSIMHPSAGLTPEKLSAVLRQAEFGDPFLYLELAEEMEEKDLHYLAVMETRKQTVAQLPMIIQPASGEREDIRIAAMVSEALFDGTGARTRRAAKLQLAAGRIAAIRAGARAGSRISCLGSAACGRPQHLEPARRAGSVIPFEKPGSRRS